MKKNNMNKINEFNILFVNLQLLFYEEKLELFKKNEIICDIIKLESDEKIKRRLEEMIQ